MVRKELIGKIEKFTIQNGILQAEFLSFGARIIKLVFNGIDVLLGYDQPDEYLSDTLFIGATVGRFAGRIGNTSLFMNKEKIQLDQNENGSTCHHGGYNAFDKRFWNAEIINENAIRFTRTSKDSEGGFPGNLDISVEYALISNRLEIRHAAKCDRDTLVNVANHAYFNLSGYSDPDARELTLNLPADHYLPLNEKLIPTGEIRPVSGSTFDFKTPRKIAIDLDHYFVYQKRDGLHHGGKLYSPKTKIQMDIETDQPGVQIYTCGAFEASIGKGGIPLHLHQGIALETQGFPDNPNHGNFPSSFLKAGDTYSSQTNFIFSLNK